MQSHMHNYISELLCQVWIKSMGGIEDENISDRSDEFYYLRLYNNHVCVWQN